MCKCVENDDRVVALNHHRQSLVQEGFLTVVIGDLSDAPFQVVHKNALLLTPITIIIYYYNNGVCV